MRSAAVFLVSFLLGSSLVLADESYSEQENAVFEQYFPSELRKSDVVVPESSKLGDLSWSNCGPATDPFKVVNITLDPTTHLHLPGTIQVGFAVNITRTISSPLQVALKVARKVVGVWVTVPCVDNYGSCVYSDGCALIKQCPDIFKQHNIPCTCPVAPGQYYLPPTNITVTSNVPSWLQSGEYQATAELSDPAGHVGCLFATIVLS